MKGSIIFTISIFMLFASISFADENNVRIKWFGQACVQLAMPDGTKIVIDPYSEKVGYPLPDLSANILLVTHEHHDHNNVSIVKGDPKILHGLKDGGKDYNKIDFSEGGVKVFSVNSYHDMEEGAKRGKNAIMVIEVNGRRIVHLGDLGQVLTDKQSNEIGAVDLLLIPVGGFYTIDAPQADEVIALLKPKVVIPMHYKTDKTEKLPISTRDGFLKGKEYKEAGSDGYDFNTAEKHEGLSYIVLDYSKE